LSVLLRFTKGESGLSRKGQAREAHFIFLSQESHLKMKGEILNILLVEDNPDHAELVMRSFQEHRVANRIHHVTHGEEALEYLFRQGAYADPETSPRPHVILLDLRLPRI